MAHRAQLLRHALPLIPQYGFTRMALAQAALHLPKPHSDPLPDRAITALFGQGDEARKTLAWAWFQEGKTRMAGPSTPRQGEPNHHYANAVKIPLSVSLRRRLQWNEPVLDFLPEVFALLASPSGRIPSVDITTVLKHPALVADEALVLSGDNSLGTSWYTRRAAIGTVYGAAELHQLRSPESTYQFLDTLLETSNALSNGVDDTIQFGEYLVKAWGAIARSKGIL